MEQVSLKKFILFKPRSTFSSYLLLFFFYVGIFISSYGDMGIFEVAVLLTVFFATIPFALKSSHVVKLFEDKIHFGKKNKFKSIKYEKIKNIRTKKLFIWPDYIVIELLSGKEISFLFYNLNDELLISSFKKYCSDKFDIKSVNSYVAWSRFKKYTDTVEKLKPFYLRRIYLFYIPLIVVFVCVILSYNYLIYFSVFNAKLEFIKAVFYLWYFVFFLMSIFLSFFTIIVWKVYEFRARNDFVKNSNNFMYNSFRKYIPTYKVPLFLSLITVSMIILFHSSKSAYSMTMAIDFSRLKDSEAKKLIGVLIDFRFNCYKCKYSIKENDLIMFYDKNGELTNGRALSYSTNEINSRSVANLENNSNLIKLKSNKKIIEVAPENIIGKGIYLKKIK